MKLNFLKHILVLELVIVFNLTLSMICSAANWHLLLKESGWQYLIETNNIKSKEGEFNIWFRQIPPKDGSDDSFIYNHRISNRDENITISCSKKFFIRNSVELYGDGMLLFREENQADYAPRSFNEVNPKSGYAALFSYTCNKQGIQGNLSRSVLKSSGGSIDQAKQEVNKGIEKLNSGDKDAAMKLFQSAIAIAPEYGPGYTEIGWINALNGDYSEAERLFQKGKSLNDPKSHYYLGLLYAQTKKFNEAFPEIDKALSLNPDDNKTIYFAAQVHCMGQDYVGATKISEKLFYKARMEGMDGMEAYTFIKELPLKCR